MRSFRRKDLSNHSSFRHEQYTALLDLETELNIPCSLQINDIIYYCMQIVVRLLYKAHTWQRTKHDWQDVTEMDNIHARGVQLLPLPSYSRISFPRSRQVMWASTACLAKPHILLPSLPSRHRNVTRCQLQGSISQRRALTHQIIVDIDF